VVEEETDRLTGMVEETVDMARVESGCLQVRRHKLEVSDLVPASLDRMASFLDGHPIDVDLQSDIPPGNIDSEPLGLALRQLISNVVKYSPPASGIEISGQESPSVVTIAVCDEGSGIPLNEIDAIFERHYRGTTTHTSISGTGMGLSIAHDIISAHGGRIWARNILEKGAEFAFLLPVITSENYS
jgi:two-component system sensor histidine kinase KdpD